MSEPATATKPAQVGFLRWPRLNFGGPGLGTGAAKKENTGDAFQELRLPEFKTPKLDRTLLYQIYRQGPLVGQKTERLVFEPSGDKRTAASNFDPAKAGSPATMYVNGITFGEKGFISTGTDLSNCLGRNVTGIVNDQSRSILGDIWNGAKGLVSHEWGASSERRAVANLKQEILAAAAAGHSPHIVAYSQGTIIVGNALDQLKRELGAEKFAKLGIAVEAFGAVTHDWPKGVNAIEYRLEGDYVAKGSSWYSSLKSGVADGCRTASAGISDLAGRTKAWWHKTEHMKTKPPEIDTQPARVVQLPRPANGDPHDLCTYFAQQPEFMIAGHTEKGKTDFRGLAEKTLSSIESGAYADCVHDKVLDYGCGNKEFAECVLSRIKDGAVGKYAIPAATLQKLISAADRR